MYNSWDLLSLASKKCFQLKFYLCTEPHVSTFSSLFIGWIFSHFNKCLLVVSVTEEADNGLFTFGLWVTTILMLAMAIVWALIAMGFAVLNASTKPIETITGPVGLYLWNLLASEYSFIQHITVVHLFWGTPPPHTDTTAATPSPHASSTSAPWRTTHEFSAASIVVSWQVSFTWGKKLRSQAKLVLWSTSDIEIGDKWEYLFPAGWDGCLLFTLTHLIQIATKRVGKLRQWTIWCPTVTKVVCPAATPGYTGEHVNVWMRSHW